MSVSNEKLKALQLTIDKLDKTYGKGTVMKLSDNKVDDIPAISTGSLGLDIALGIGGLPRGRVVEIYGPESSGKTTLALHVAAEAQKKGGNKQQRGQRGKREENASHATTINRLELVASRVQDEAGGIVGKADFLTGRRTPPRCSSG